MNKLEEILDIKKPQLSGFYFLLLKAN